MAQSKDKKRKRYHGHSKPSKKTSRSLRPGVQGFFITCDGGKEKRASYEAINIIESLCEAMAMERDPTLQRASMPSLNKKMKFRYSDSSSGEEEEEVAAGMKENGGSSNSSSTGGIVKKQSVDTCAVSDDGPAVDRLIEAEIEELCNGDGVHFVWLDSGCNGVGFIEMLGRKEGDPSPKEIVQKLMTSTASSRKHISRFILRMLPIEVSCYASEEEIRSSVKPLITRYFPEDAETPLKFSVLYDARANTGIERMKVIDAVAKLVPPPHKVDLGNPDLNIVVQVVRTVCLVGVVEKYKELSKYNIRQLTSPKQ